MENNKNSSTEHSRSIPQLRFPEFNNEWEMKKLGNIAKFSKGKGLAKSDIIDNGKNECIRYGELYTKYNEVISDIYSRTNLEINNSVVSEENDVIIPASGETQIDIATASCVAKSGVILGGDLNIIKTINNGVFLSYYLNNRKKLDIARLSQGISVVHLYSSQLGSLSLNIPTLPEQKKIASFLTAVDNKLQALKKKKALLEEYKKGIMQKIFSQEIRFKPALSNAEGDDNGNKFPDWEVKKLGEVVKVRSSKRVLQKDWVEAGVPFYRTREIINLSNGDDFKTPIFITKDLFSSISGKYGIPSEGDILVTGVGTIGKTYIVKKTDEFYFKDGNVLWLELTKRKINPMFLSQLFKTRFVKKQLTDNASITTVATFTIEGANKTKIYYPILEEQTKIANFLTAIDDKIEHCQTQIDNTEKYKKGLLQKMFV